MVLNSISKIALVRIEGETDRDAAIAKARTIIHNGLSRYRTLYRQTAMGLESFLDAVYPEDKDLDPSIKLLRYEALGDDGVCDRIAQIGDGILDKFIPKKDYEKFMSYCPYHLSLKELDFFVEGNLPTAIARIIIKYNLVTDGWVYGDAGKALTVYAGGNVDIPAAIHYTKYNKVMSKMLYPALGKELYAKISYLTDGKKLIPCSKECEDEVEAFFRTGEDVFIVSALVWQRKDSTTC